MLATEFVFVDVKVRDCEVVTVGEGLKVELSNTQDPLKMLNPLATSQAAH